MRPLINEARFNRLLTRAALLPLLLMALLSALLIWQIVILLHVFEWVEHTDRVHCPGESLAESCCWIWRPASAAICCPATQITWSLIRLGKRRSDPPWTDWEHFQRTTLHRRSALRRCELLSTSGDRRARDDRAGETEIQLAIDHR